jgi:hypothetical protein
VVVYCDGVDSEAQHVGCLSHVSESDVCAQDTEAQQFAVKTYIDETGDDAICD